MERLPCELLQLIAALLPLPDAVRVSQTETVWRTAVKRAMDSVYWARHRLRLLPQHAHSEYRLARGSERARVRFGEIIAVRRETRRGRAVSVHFLTRQLTVNDVPFPRPTRQHDGVSVAFQGVRYWDLGRIWHDYELVAHVAGSVVWGESVHAVLARAANRQARLCCYEAIDWEVERQVPRVHFDEDFFDVCARRPVPARAVCVSYDG